MGSVSAFPRRLIDDRATLHVTADGDGGFEVAHESRSGNSWGNFHRFSDPSEAVAAAYRLNRDNYENGCEVYVAPEVIASLPVSPSPDPGGF